MFARLAVLAADQGYQVATENRPFDGVPVDARNGEHAVWIAFGSTPADRYTHSINRVTAIRMLPASDDTGVVLAVDAADGTRTIFELTAADAYALPAGTAPGVSGPIPMCDGMSRRQGTKLAP